MSTPNFSKKNASKFYSNELENDFDYDDLKMNLQCEFGEENNVEKFDGDRNYGGAIISQLEKSIGKWDIEIQVIIRGGYYSGCNLDWNIFVSDANIGTLYEYGEDWGNGVPKYVYNQINRMIKKVEKVFESYSTPLICTAIFSNGEAIYQKAK